MYQGVLKGFGLLFLVISYFHDIHKSSQAIKRRQTQDQKQQKPPKHQNPPKAKIQKSLKKHTKKQPSQALASPEVLLRMEPQMRQDARISMSETLRMGSDRWVGGRGGLLVLCCLCFFFFNGGFLWFSKGLGFGFANFW